MNRTVILLFTGYFALLAAGQLTARYAALNFMITPLVFIFFTARMLLWLKILKKLPLSKAYPLNSLSYLIIPLISETLFPEKLSLHNYAGVLLIVTGLILTGQEKKS